MMKRVSKLTSPVVLGRSSTGCSESLAADPCHETVGADITEEYAIGETDFERWGRLWKACASDPELDGEEWVIFLERIQEHFRNNYENFPDEFYFWGDFSGDRTLDLKISKPTVLTARLLSDLQEYLQINGQKMWRIRIPIYFQPNDSRRVVVVYPHAIDIPPILASSIRSSLDHCAHDDALWRRGCSVSSGEVQKGRREAEVFVVDREPAVVRRRK